MDPCKTWPRLSSKSMVEATVWILESERCESKSEKCHMLHQTHQFSNLWMNMSLISFHRLIKESKCSSPGRAVTVSKGLNVHEMFSKLVET